MLPVPKKKRETEKAVWFCPPASKRCAYGEKRLFIKLHFKPHLKSAFGSLLWSNSNILFYVIIKRFYTL